MQQFAINHNLAMIFDSAHLGLHVINNPSQHRAISVRTKSTVVEALLGAVYENTGIQTALAVMRYLQME
ncbi:uncharacterized protein PgNI_10021 [Pyricularia grisea]|uniref:RNase III domain-containing protein n=1 Tax=Pyricularia grisea TaxID=148305 RepID=A0A6P8AS78_PYRGI|nr:uncharacterized protein PgNI_10021 [Pyricularia grisea]TLD04975.1 hypothetical protein PgNI_10021 [Pyricularia grisea]